MTGSRVSNSLRNVFAAWGGQAIYAFGAFAVRAVFVATLAQEYVGLESLFSSILTILSLADLGIGSAIVFALYEPLAVDNKELVKSLMRLFKRTYITIGIVIIALGLLIAPNIEMFLGKNPPDIDHLQLYFFCFVMNTGVSYFFSYKGSLIMADQKSYVVYIIQYSFQIAMCCIQIAVLLITGSYLLFLVCMVSSTLLQNIFIAITSNRMYPYLKEKDVSPVDKEVLSQVKKNVAGLIMHKLAGAASTPASNLIITNFVGLATTSLYGNYLLVINALTQVLNKVFDSIVASVGNLGVLESKARQREVFQITLFLNATIYAVVASGLLCSLNPFIGSLFGKSWEFPLDTVFLITLLFYVKGMRSAGQSFISAYGLFWHTKWKAVLEAVFLPALSIALVFPFGINGVLAGCILSSLLVSTTYEGWAVYKYALELPFRLYVVRFVSYMAVTMLACFTALLVCDYVNLTGWIGFFAKGFIGVLLSLLMWLVVYGRSFEFRETAGIVRRLTGGIARRLSGKD